MTLASRQGFSLLELAIVIVIIGLIMGGVMSGQSLIRNAQLSSVGGDLERYRQAVGSFQSQYKELPGDFTRAETLWGSDPGGCPAGSNETPKTQTCNGNGSGIVNTAEIFRFWQHLANAKMVDGAFSGNANSGNSGVAGVNVPKLRYEGGQVLVDYYGSVSGDSTRFNDQYGHVYVVGKTGNAALFTTEDAKNLDKKYDDGIAPTGVVKGFKHDGSHECVKSDNTDYDLDNKATRCHLIFNSGI